MDSFEMSVTSTDCQFPGCPYVASVYTYPFCHEHKKLSPQYKRSGQQTAASGHNDLNREHKPKSSSLTEAGNREDEEVSLERQHSRSLEDMVRGSAGQNAESIQLLCTAPRCKLRGHPEQDFLCTQHYILAQAQKNPEMPPAPGTGHSQLKHDNSSQTGRSINVNNIEVVTPTRSISRDAITKCKTPSCNELGTEVFHGLCANCYIGKEIGEDTEVIEDRRKCQEDQGTGDSFHDTETLSFTDRKEEDKSEENLSKRFDAVKVEYDDKPRNVKNPLISSEVKQATNTSESHEYHKCKNSACNRLAPVGSCEGLCSDCSTKKREVVIVSPPVTEPKPLRVDTVAQAPEPFPSSQHRGISLQSFPSVPIQQTFPNPPIPTKETVEPPPPLTATEISQALKCATPTCSGIYVNLDKNHTGLCYSCLKAATKQTKNVASESTKSAKERANQVAGESPPRSIKGEASAQLLRRQSGGRRSGRNRHTIAFPPKSGTTKSGMDSSLCESQKKCVSPLCDKPGSVQFSGFCPDCYEWMCLKFEQIQNQEGESEMTPCKSETCEYFGTTETNGYCSQCHRKLAGKEVWFGADRRRCSNGRSITPPPGHRGDLCANPCCDQYGNKAFYNFCPSCFKVFDTCTGIQYSPPPSRRSLRPPNSAILDSEPYCWTPPPPPRRDSIQHSGANNASMPTSFIAPASISSEVGEASFNPSASYYMSQTSSVGGAAAPGTPKEPVNVSARYWEVMEGVESASRLGKSKCLVPSCRSFGNSKCKGYCNSCFVKHHAFV